MALGARPPVSMPHEAEPTQRRAQFAAMSRAVLPPTKPLPDDVQRHAFAENFSGKARQNRLQPELEGREVCLGLLKGCLFGLLPLVGGGPCQLNSTLCVGRHGQFLLWCSNIQEGFCGVEISAMSGFDLKQLTINF
jgi:hypothetical protein